MDFILSVLVFHIGGYRVGLGDAAVEKIVNEAEGSMLEKYSSYIHNICDF